MMKFSGKNIYLIPALLALVGGAGASFAFAKSPKIVVIVKADGALAGLAAQDIRSVYLGDKSFEGSAKIEPLVNGDDALTDLFLKKVLNKTKTQYKKIWGAKAFIDGLAAPSVLPASEDVIRMVENDDDAIGFVAEKDLLNNNKNLKVIYSVDPAEK
jgi:ABC-type phosphate transport system substrate-binding protein